MYATYNNYTHTGATACNLVRMEYLPQFSPRGKRWGVKYRLHISGELLYSNESDLNTAIGALITAYEEDGHSWTLYHTDGSPTRHRLEQNAVNDLSGVRVVHRSWPTGEGAEYATGRKYYIVLEQTVKDVYSNIIEYEESVRYIGTGGPEVRLVQLPSGYSVQQTVSLYTPIQVIQRGTVVTLQYPWLLPEIAAAPLYPGYEDTRQRISDFVSPQYLGNGYVNYRTNWTYVFNIPYLPGNVYAAPHVPIY